MGKERYKVKVSNDLKSVGVFDLQENEYVVNERVMLLNTAYLLCDLFNKVDKQGAKIKELETCLDKEINNLYNDLFIKNQQLKQSQKQLAIKELEKLRPLITRQAYICGGKATENEIVETNAYNRCLEDIKDILHNQIKQLEAQNEV